jgi:hypothetical protein
MKKTVADYIERLMVSGKPLTDAQARQVAYWEFVDFQQGIVEPENLECSEAIDKLLKGIRS